MNGRTCTNARQHASRRMHSPANVHNQTSFFLTSLQDYGATPATIRRMPSGCVKTWLSLETGAAVTAGAPGPTAALGRDDDRVRVQRVFSNV